MANATLWIQFEDGEDCAWTAELGVDFDRFQTDDYYAHVVSEHINNHMSYLAAELEAIAVSTPANREVPSCE